MGFLSSLRDRLDDHPPPQQHHQQNGHGGRNDYAPPQGPPPGYQGQNGYGPPPGNYGNGGDKYGGPPPGGYRPPPAGNYGNGHGQYGAPPPQPPRPDHGQHRPPPPGQGYGGPPPNGQGYGGPPPHHPPPQNSQGYGGRPPPPSQQNHHNGAAAPSSNGSQVDNLPWVPPKVGLTRLTRKTWFWTDYSRDYVETVCEFGPVCKGEAFYSVKFSLTGKTKLKQGVYDDDGPLVGEVDCKGTFSAKYLPTFNGYQTQLKDKAYSMSGSCKHFTFECPINGRPETFEWTYNDTSMSAKLTGMKGWRLDRKGTPEGAPPLVLYTDAEPNGLRSKSKMGTLEFMGEAATGQFGDLFPNLVLLTFLSMKQQKHVVDAAKDAAGGI